MAIRILLDHGVQQDHIIFVTFLIAQRGGISVLHRAYPGVRIVCGAVDQELREAWLDTYHETDHGPESIRRKVWFVEPGIGHIGECAIVFVYACN